MKKVLFISDSTYPYGAAYSSRMRHLVYLLRYAGYCVDLIVANDNSQSVSNDRHITYVNEKEDIISRNCSLCARPYAKALNKYLEQNQVSLIISSSMPFMTPSLFRVAKKHKIPYVIEQCEWFDKSTFRFGTWNPRYRKHIHAIKNFNMKLDGVIAISRLFEQYYCRNNIPTIRIPTIVDTKDSKISYPEKSKYLRIVFAGSLGNGKEHLAYFVEAISRVNEKSIHIVMDIYGPDKQEVLSNIGKDHSWLDKAEEYIRIHGRIPQSQVSKCVSQADFSVIMRPLRRSSNAGFPTKLAESMEVGTPVIANDTGDIALYIESGHNGFIVEDNVEKIYGLLSQLIHLSDDELLAMRNAARLTTEKSFDYRNYTDAIRRFVDAIIEKA